MAYKVLVAEDDLLTSKAIEQMLKKEGYDVYKAYNGKIATKILEEKKIDVLLVDIYMPLISGMELISYVRNELKQTIPIGVISRIGLKDTINKAFELGADDYITKPFDSKELADRIRKLTKKK